MENTCPYTLKKGYGHGYVVSGLFLGIPAQNHKKNAVLRAFDTNLREIGKKTRKIAFFGDFEQV